MKNSVFVTGATGFVGSFLVKYLLEKGWKVSVFSRSGQYTIQHQNLSIIKGDIRDKVSLISATQNIRYVVHLAAAKQDEKDSYQINALGTQYLVDACKVNDVERIVNLSTLSTKIKEKGVYAYTKNEADSIIMKSGIPFIILKPSIIYGNLKNGVFGSIAQFSKLPVTPVFGSGECLFRPVYILDVVRVIEKALIDTSVLNKVYDVVGPDVVSFNTLIVDIGRYVFNKTVRIMHVPKMIGFVVAKVLSYVFYKAPITRSNILGSTQDVQMDYDTFSKDFQVKPIDLREGLSILKMSLVYDEAELVLCYIASRSVPQINITEREKNIYHEVLDKAGISKDFDVSVYKYPFLLGLLDCMTLVYKDSTLSQKLYIGSAILEASPVSAEWLISQKKSVFKVVLLSGYLAGSFILKALAVLPLLLFPNFIKRNVV